jgi:hypothetical protein
MDVTGSSEDLGEVAETESPMEDGQQSPIRPSTALTWKEAGNIRYQQDQDYPGAIEHYTGWCTTRGLPTSPVPRRLTEKGSFLSSGLGFGVGLDVGSVLLPKCGISDCFVLVCCGSYATCSQLDSSVTQILK